MNDKDGKSEYRGRTSHYGIDDQDTETYLIVAIEWMEKFENGQWAGVDISRWEFPLSTYGRLRFEDGMLIIPDAVDEPVIILHPKGKELFARGELVTK